MAKKKKKESRPAEQKPAGPKKDADGGGKSGSSKAAKKPEVKMPDFHEIFMSKISWLSNILPFRIDCRQNLIPYMREMPDAAKSIAKAVCSGHKYGRAEHLPWLACVILAFIGAEGHTGKRNNIVNAICDLAVALHNAQHESWGESSWDRLILHPSDLCREAAVTFFRREKREAEEACGERRAEKAGEAAMRYQLSCLFLDHIGDFPNSDHDPYVDEIPKRKCPVCGRFAWPAPESGVVENKGRRFFCPFCGYDYGWQGMKKQIRNGDGSRKHSTAWTADRMGIDYCQICGRHLNELKKTDGFLSAHHLKTVSEGGLDVPSNILIVCWDCHEKIHMLRGDIPPRKN